MNAMVCFVFEKKKCLYDNLWSSPTRFSQNTLHLFWSYPFRDFAALFFYVSGSEESLFLFIDSTFRAPFHF